jgi:hypothetical protein
MKLIYRLFLGLIVWLTFTEIERTYNLTFYTLYTVLILFFISLVMTLIGKIISKYKENKFYKTSFKSAIYLASLLVLIFTTNAIYKNIARNTFDKLVSEINLYKNEKGQLPKRTSDLKSSHSNIYALLEHEFIYEGYKPYVWTDGEGFVLSKEDSKNEKMVGYKYPLGYAKYKISCDDKNLNLVIQEMDKDKTWFEIYL